MMVLETIQRWFEQNAFKVYFRVTKNAKDIEAYYIFPIEDISMIKLWEDYIVEFHASLYIYQVTWNFKIMFSMKYIPAFVNNHIFGGLKFNELIIKCFWSFKPSLTMKY